MGSNPPPMGSNSPPMESSPVPMDYYNEQENKLWKKMKAQPFVPVGVAGMIGMVLYGAYNFKNRGKMPVSLYLIRLRVRAQAMVVGAITLGVSYSLITDYYKKGRKDEQQGVDKLH